MHTSRRYAKRFCHSLAASAALAGIVALAATSGCEDEDGASTSRPTVTASDASSPSAPAVADATTPTVTTPLAPPVSLNDEIDAGPLPVEDPSEWLGAERFTVAVERSRCYGICPVFSVRVDERGHVVYRGSDYVARPGYYEVEVPSETARRLFMHMVDAGFLGLRPRYYLEADGCTDTSTDAPTSTFTLTANDRSKQVRMYWGCEADVVATLRELDDAIEQATTAGRFLYPNPGFDSCPSGGDNFSEQWVVSNNLNLNHVDIGLLHLDTVGTQEPRWQIADCQGDLIAEGAVARTRCSVHLLPPKDVDAYISWPGVTERQGVATLEHINLDGWLSVRLLNLLEEQHQSAHEGEACDR